MGYRSPQICVVSSFAKPNPNNLTPRRTNKQRRNSKPFGNLTHAGIIARINANTPITIHNRSAPGTALFNNTHTTTDPEEPIPPIEDINPNLVEEISYIPESLNPTETPNQTPEQNPSETNNPFPAAPTKLTMALNIGHLFDAASSESEPERDSRPLSDHDRDLRTSINKKTDELQKAAVEGIHLNHHLKNAKEAIKSGKPPHGLTPKLNVTAYKSTKELQEAVDQEMSKAGLAVCNLLQQHFSKALKESGLACMLRFYK